MFLEIFSQDFEQQLTFEMIVVEPIVIIQIVKGGSEDSKTEEAHWVTIQWYPMWPSRDRWIVQSDGVTSGSGNGEGD